MANRTALITGVLGQDGSLLAALLLSRGYRVVGITRPARAGATPATCPDIHLASVDLGDAIAVQELLDRSQPDEIYHLAAFHHASQDTAVNAGLAGKEAMLNTNFLATKNLAFALTAAKSKCHLVYAASSQMYTARAVTTEIDEQTVRRPSTFYGHTKSWGMDLLGYLRDESNLIASTAILFNHESTRRSAQFVSRKITVAAARAAKGLQSPLSLYNLATRVDWSSAHDVVHALTLMARSEKPRDFVVSSGVLHSVRDMLEEAFGHVGLNWREFTTVQEDRMTPALVGRSHRLEEALGWKRAISFNEMVAMMVEHDLEEQRAP